jgi:TonB family protein
MQPAVQRAREPERPIDSIEELPSHSRLPRLDLGVEWESRTEEFRSSLYDFFAGPRPRKGHAAPGEEDLHVDFVEPKLPLGGFLASCLWHVAAIWILILPIWGFLPSAQPTLKPLNAQLTWYTASEDLPHIVLHRLDVKRAPAARKPTASIPSPATNGADVYHPRQTVLSIPFHVTHPRQTLIQPDAPATPPKVAPPLPNIVQWTENEPPKPRLEFSAKASTPRVERHEVGDLAAPEISKADRDASPLNINSTAIAKPQLAMPVSTNATAVARRRAARENAAGPAPEIGDAAQGDPGLRRLIALSAAPAPPAPEVSVPEGNLGARISVSPEAPNNGEPGGKPGSKAAGAGEAGRTSGSFPAEVRVAGGNPRGPMAAISGERPRALILKPLAPYQPSGNVRQGPANVAGLSSGLPPEALLSGKEVYTLHVNMPNLTSATGSWILNFAQLDEDTKPFQPKPKLSSPVPVEKVDPEYPPDAIKAHIQGEVVLYAIIRKDGSVDSIQVVRGIDPALDRNAIAALAQWKFRPGTIAGTPVDLEAVIHIPFEYKDPRDQ